MIYIGTSGYSYQDWRGRFYLIDLPQKQWLEYYTEHFNSVEINLTLYRLPASSVFRHWRTRTPKDFRFVLKGSRLITHSKRLRDCHESLAEFFERASELQEKLSCVLWQLPSKFPHDVELLENFLAEVERVQIVYGKFRQAFEFRNMSWFEEPIYEVMRQYNVMVALSDWPFEIKYQVESSKYKAISNSLDTYHLIHDTNSSKVPISRPEIEVPLISDFLYLRRHGPVARNASPYSEEEIKLLADELRPDIKSHRDVYVFFNNNTNAYATQNAKQLKSELS